MIFPLMGFTKVEPSFKLAMNNSVSFWPSASPGFRSSKASLWYDGMLGGFGTGYDLMVVFSTPNSRHFSWVHTARDSPWPSQCGSDVYWRFHSRAFCSLGPFRMISSRSLARTLFRAGMSSEWPAGWCLIGAGDETEDGMLAWMPTDKWVRKSDVVMNMNRLGIVKNGG